jgi:uncharacterized protein
MIPTVIIDLRRRLEAIYGDRLKNMVLYGSWARGEATEDSDVDVAIVLSGRVQPGREIDRMMDAVADHNLLYATLISIYPVSEEDFRTLNSPLLINVRRERVAA